MKIIKDESYAVHHEDIYETQCVLSSRMKQIYTD